jgi:hypothetical protein
VAFVEFMEVTIARDSPHASGARTRGAASYPESASYGYPYSRDRRVIPAVLPLSREARTSDGPLFVPNKPEAQWSEPLYVPTGPFGSTTV